MMGTIFRIKIFKIFHEGEKYYYISFCQKRCFKNQIFKAEIYLEMSPYIQIYLFLVIFL